MIGTERNGDGQQQEHGMQVSFMYTRVYQSMLGLSCSVLAWHGIIKRVEAIQCRDAAAVRGVVGFCRTPTAAKRMHAITAS